MKIIKFPLLIVVLVTLFGAVGFGQTPSAAKTVTLAQLVNGTGLKAEKIDEETYLLSAKTVSNKPVSILVAKNSEILIMLVELAKGNEYTASPALHEALLRYQSKADWIRIDITDDNTLQLFVHDNWGHTNQKDVNQKMGQMIATIDGIYKVLAPYLKVKK